MVGSLVGLVSVAPSAAIVDLGVIGIGVLGLGFEDATLVGVGSGEFEGGWEWQVDGFGWGDCGLWVEMEVCLG